MNYAPKYNKFFEYYAYNLQTGEELKCEDSLSPMIKHIRKDIKVQHGNKVRAEILEHGVAYINGYGRRDDNNQEYYSWALYLKRWTE